MKETKGLDWFINRINKTIYRDWHTGGVVSIKVHDYAFAKILYNYEMEGLVTYRDSHDPRETDQPAASEGRR